MTMSTQVVTIPKGTVWIDKAMQLFIQMASTVNSLILSTVFQEMQLIALCAVYFLKAQAEVMLINCGLMAIISGLK